MPKFRKKPVVIEARQLSAQNVFEIAEWSGARVRQPGNIGRTGAWITIPTLEGDHQAHSGDWIICGVEGEFYPCKPRIFEATYEPVEESVGDPLHTEAAASDLLASHEEGAGDMCSACAGSGTPISGKPCICGGAGTLVAEANGLRRALYDADEENRRLRSHTNREPDGWAVLARWVDGLHPTVWGGEETFDAHVVFGSREEAEEWISGPDRSPPPDGFVARPFVYIGPPVQPEEES